MHAILPLAPTGPPELISPAEFGELSRRFPSELDERTAMYNNDTVLLFWQQNTPNGIMNFMETWVKDGGQWKCAAAHVSRPAVGGGREGGRGDGRGRGGD
jgi:hypothetical protein